jgi:hypothetical protein
MPREVATNLELQKWIARQYGFDVESALIEQSKQQLGLRPPSQPTNTFECSPEQYIAIKRALQHFGLLC